MTDPKSPFPFTPVRVSFDREKIRAQGTLAAIGSCFSEDLAATLLQSGMRGMRNPNGILYNPYSICDALARLSCGYAEDDFFEFGGLWHSWRHHGSFSGPDRAECVRNANDSAKRFARVLKKADVFWATFSTAIVYRHRKTGRIVANCHKVPGTEFERILLAEEVCEAAILSACRLVRERNPNCPIILTLSPVIHSPGDPELDARSKATLLLAIHGAREAMNDCWYFPAYEIMTRELRDYRFYSDDMLHPSSFASTVILERFLDACFIPRARADWEKAEAERRRERHRPLHEKEKEQES